MKPAPKKQGVLNGRSKLSEEAVIEIRNSQGPQRLLAEKYGVAQTLISRIRRGAAWRYLKEDNT